MRAETWSRRLLVLGTLSLFLFSGLGHAQVPGELPDVGGSTGGSGSGSLPTGTDADGNVGAGVNGTSGSISGDGSITQGGIGLPNVTLPGQAGIFGIGSHATWEFDLELYNLSVQERFRFRSPTGELRDQVSIAVTWTDSFGRIKDYPDGDQPRALLNILSEDRRHDMDFEPDAWMGNHTAIYNLSDEDLIQGAETKWILRAYAGNEEVSTPVASVGAYSLYNRWANSTAFPASAVDDAMDTQYTTVAVYDRDRDSHPDDRDNCPGTANEDQANMDKDLHGDACDDDIDGDGYNNTYESDEGSDPRDRASTPLDRDADGYNNTAEAEARSDPDDPDSTPLDPDADGYRTSTEERARSDPYDPASTPRDYDGDGLENRDDNCRRDANPDQEDGDSDGIGDACDRRPEDGPTGDEDGDGVLNEDDNCRDDENADQSNMDGDSLGDICDEDVDGDGYVDGDDAFPEDGSEWHDNDGDGMGDNADQDDDNDGLSDTAEMAIGTSPLRVDTDGDVYSDLDELQLQTDPLDDLSPDFRPTNARTTGLDDGRIRIEWDASTDARVTHYLVWSKSDVRTVALVDASQTSVVDDFLSGGDVQYVVQAILLDQPVKYHAEHGVETFLFASEVVAWTLDSEGGGAADAKQAEPDIEAPPGQGAPGVAVIPVLLALGLVAMLRRRD